MLARRFAAAIGLLLAVVTSQLPEYVQQYRQRLGGAVDELKAIIAEFDAEAGRLSLSRDQAVARLHADADVLAQERGTDVENDVERETRLEGQQQAFSGAGPVSQYWALLTGFDPALASRAYADFQPAVPVTTAGLLAAAVGLIAGWSLTHAVAWPLRRRRKRNALARTDA